MNLVLKATVILCAGLAAATIPRRARASFRHLVLATALCAVTLLPAAMALLPHVGIPVPFARELGTHGSAISQSRADGQVTAGSSGAPQASTSAVIVGVWVLGLVACLIPIAGGLLQLRRISQLESEQSELRDIVRDTAIERGIARPIRVLVHQGAALPMTFGGRRPTMVLPGSAAPRSDDTRRAILHELEHIRRRDWLVALAARIACAIYWFHPLAWIAFRRMRLHAEIACDDAVAQDSDAADYALQLVRMARHNVRKQPLTMLSIVGTSDLSMRVRALLDERRRRGASSRLSFWAVNTACACTILIVAPLAPANQARVLPPATREAARTIAVPVQSGNAPDVAPPSIAPTGSSQPLRQPVEAAKSPAPRQSRPAHTASVHGTVTDEDGAPLARVVVECESDDGDVRTTITDDAGGYAVDALPAGIYSVTFRLMEYRTFKREGLRVAQRAAITMNVSLKSDPIRD